MGEKLEKGKRGSGEKALFALFGKTERPMSDIGLSRLAETFSLEVTVLTPVTQRLWAAFYPLLARRQ
jgi:hypothetical protein